MNITELESAVLAETPVSPTDVLSAFRAASHEELWEAAHRVTAHFKPRTFDFCAIVNARSGRCSENCKWCAQSAHWQTACKQYGWIGTEACVKAAQEAERNGVSRLGIVTSGRGQTPAQIDEICDALRAIKANSRISRSGSLADAAGYRMRTRRVASTSASTRASRVPCSPRPAATTRTTVSSRRTPATQQKMKIYVDSSAVGETKRDLSLLFCSSVHPVGGFLI